MVTTMWSGAAKPRSAAARLTPRVHHLLQQPEWLDAAAKEKPETNFKSVIVFVCLCHIFTSSGDRIINKLQLYDWVFLLASHFLRATAIGS